MLFPLDALGQEADGKEELSPEEQLIEESQNLYRSGEMDSAISKALEAEQLVIAEAATPTKYGVYRQLVRLHLLGNQLYRAKDFLEDAELVAEDLDSLPLVAEVNYFFGYLYNKLGKSDESLRYYDSALAQSKEVGDSTRLLKIYINMGRIYGDQLDFQTSIGVTQQAVELAEELTDSTNLSIALQNLGANYQALGKLDSALAVLNRALLVNTSPRTQFRNVYPLINIANIQQELEEMDAFRETVFEAYKIAEASGIPDLMAVTERQLGEYYLEIKELDSALTAGEEAWSLALQSGDLRLQGPIMQLLVKVNRELKDYKAALCWMEFLLDHKLEMLSSEKLQFGEEMRVRFDVEKKEAENVILRQGQAELKKQTRLTYIVAGLVVVLLVGIVLILARAYNRGKRFGDTLKAKNDEIEASNELLRSLNADKDALMGIVAHDLKAPLSKIAGLLDVMEIVRDNPEEFARTKRMMESVVESGAYLINELVLMSSLEKTKVVSELEEVSVEEILQECLAGFKGSAEKKSIGLHLEIGAGGPPLKTSRKYLLRVLDNLVSNAIKFSPRDRNVYLKGSHQQGGWTIDVQDEGPGIPEDDQVRLFEKFVRLDNRPTAGESSTGLGLSIVKELVDQLGGTIEVISSNGHGATFRLVLSDNATA